MIMTEPLDSTAHSSADPMRVAPGTGEDSSSLKPEAAGFEAGHVMTFTFAHGVHDTYSSFVAPLLPSLIHKL